MLQATKRQPPLGFCAILPLSPLYQGTGKSEEQSQEESHLPSGAPSLGYGAQGCKVVGLSLEEDIASFLSLFRVKIDLTCHVPILACWYSNHLKVAAHVDCVTIAIDFRNIFGW